MKEINVGDWVRIVNICHHFHMDILYVKEICFDAGTRKLVYLLSKSPLCRGITAPYRHELKTF